MHKSYLKKSQSCYNMLVELNKLNRQNTKIVTSESNYTLKKQCFPVVFPSKFKNK